MNKKTKEILAFTLLIASFIIISILFSSDTGLHYPDYTVFSANEEGVSLIYDTLSALDYPVEVTTRAVSPYTDKAHVQIILYPSVIHTKKQDMEQLASFIERGGKAIIFYQRVDMNISALRSLLQEAEMIPFHNGTMIHFGLGYVYMEESESLLNASLMAYGNHAGENMMTVLDGFGYQKIYFNEYYHGFGSEKGLWQAVPLNIKITVYQMAILTACIVFYLGRRFGRPVPYYEEIEREENEYVFTLANLYGSVGMGQVIVSMFYDQLKADAIRYFRLYKDAGDEEIYTYWQMENLPELQKLQFVLQNKDREFHTKTRSGKREFSKIIGYMKDLTKIVNRKLF